MFTGMIGGVGRVARAEFAGGEARVRVACPRGFLRAAALAVGGSIAVDGVCLTASRRGGLWFDSHWSRETLSRVVAPAVDRAVNLELPLRAGDPMGGHFVAGHIDGVAEVVDFPQAKIGMSRRLSLRPPRSTFRFLIEKGSIAVNGVSLTVNSIDARRRTFAAQIIPHTLSATNLAALRPGDEVNIEADLLAKKAIRAG